MRHHHRALSKIALIAPLLAMAAVGCQDQRRSEQGDRSRTETAQRTQTQESETRVTQRTGDAEKAQTTTTVDQVKEAPANYYDKDVRVAGKVDEILGDKAFELEGSGWAFNDNITVLTKTPVQFTGVGLARRDEVLVEGKVRRFVTADIERDLGWDMTPEVEVRLKERPVLVADSIRRITESGRWRSDTSKEQPIAAIVTVVTAVDPNALVGQSVDLERERVQAVQGKGLWVGPSPMSQIYVVPDQLPPDIKAGDVVHVRGTLQKVPKDALKAWGLPTERTGSVTEDMLFIDKATVTETVTTGA